MYPGGLGAGAGAGVGHELRRILFEKESLAPFVGKSLKPTRLAFNYVARQGRTGNKAGSDGRLTTRVYGNKGKKD